ncbi:hypothetical protein [Flavobacterium sp. 245]|uniref:hypothetical protein n=1 Tax=Flavobacterium sp. 245 TaxID=2512115 RepID=UPI0010608522|nr:hypothetical protein [Flavobacterium sp. 245]TDO99099.1 hypothetical protein EV145_1076 [Flavobacterium sp. 245]
MKRTLLFFITLFCCAVSAQNKPNVKKDIKLFYKPPSQVSGFTLVTVNLSYAVVNVFGEIQIQAEAKCSNNLEYQYKGRQFTFSGNEVPVRSVVVRDPIIKVVVTGPNNFRKEMKLWILGLGANAFGDSSPIKDAKTPEEKDPSNYNVEIIGVESVSYNGLSSLINEIESKLREEKKLKELQGFIENGDNALNRENFSEAENNYKAILRLDKDNAYAKTQLEKIRQRVEKLSSKKRYDDAMNAAQAEEARGNYDNASRLYEEASKEDVNNGYAKNQSDRVNDLKERKVKEAEDKAKAIKEKIEKEEKANTEAYEKKEAEKKKFQAERDRIADELLQARKDSIADSLDRQDREKVLEEAKKLREEQEEREKAQEKADEDELKKEALERRSEDDEQISAIEEIMQDDPIKYTEYLDIAWDLREKADNIKPYDELELKKEWWDNNTYIQNFADDLYEPQIRQNHENYMKKSAEAKAAYYTAKNGYMDAMQYVDKGSKDQKWLLNQIEYCNKRIDSYESNYKTDFNSENLRIKQKNYMKSMAEANRMSDNRQKAALAYDILATSPEDQNQYLTKKYDLYGRMENAHQQYLADAAVAGVSQSVVLDMWTNGKSVDESGKNFMFNFYSGIEYNSVPILMNKTSDQNTPITTTEDLTAAVANIGVNIWFYRSKYFDVNLGTSAGYGVYPMEGIKVSYLHYNAKVNLDFGYEWFKVATLFQYLGRSGSQEIDYDVSSANAYGSTVATNTIGKGEFDYSIMRVGAGLKLFGRMDKYSNLTVMLNVDKPSFYDFDFFEKPLYMYSLTYSSADFGIGFEFSNNYVIAGVKEYSLPDPKSTPYYSIKLFYEFSLL